MNKRNVKILIQKHSHDIHRMGVKKIGLFGSFAREEQHSDSDIDLLVEFQRGKKNFDNFIRLSFLLEDILGRPVELVTPESLSPYLRPYIMEQVEYVPLTS